MSLPRPRILRDGNTEGCPPPPAPTLRVREDPFRRSGRDIVGAALNDAPVLFPPPLPTPLQCPIFLAPSRERCLEVDRTLTPVTPPGSASCPRRHIGTPPAPIFMSCPTHLMRLLSSAQHPFVARTVGLRVCIVPAQVYVCDNVWSLCVVCTRVCVCSKGGTLGRSPGTIELLWIPQGPWRHPSAEAMTRAPSGTRDRYFLVRFHVL